MHLANAMRQQSIGGTHVSGNQSFYGAPPGDLDNSLRQQRTEDNHISINGQIYPIDGPNVNVERNTQMKCGGSLSIDESPMGNVRIESGGSLNINKSQMENSQIDVGGNIGIVESPMGSIGIDCGGSLRIEKSKMETGNMDCGGSSSIVESTAQNLKLDCGRSLNMKSLQWKMFTLIVVEAQPLRILILEAIATLVVLGRLEAHKGLIIAAIVEIWLIHCVNNAPRKITFQLMDKFTQLTELMLMLVLKDMI
ncbi:hypothetical protein niasHT_004167 [Heterodera trifolii]|uniref:Uncharacterized protein n=1 Tax=Heterodera trifolii TaxID=157864 RepID=A0ABD2LQG9_9BILA